ncbi:hypothetical protein VTK56DRAFT_6549 [Thermocarpiscus australiensis]
MSSLRRLRLCLVEYSSCLEQRGRRSKEKRDDRSQKPAATATGIFDSAPKDETSKHVIEYATRGVRALIESTRAFHGLKEKRFIVTNIFGTAHAQWSNLLTLSAVFRDPTLQGFVEEHLLRDLFARTISFFRIIAHPTSALHVDLRILEGLQRKLWGRSAALDGLDRPTDFSFSSHSPGGGSPPLVSPPSPVNAPDGHRMHLPVQNHSPAVALLRGPHDTRNRHITLPAFAT